MFCEFDRCKKRRIQGKRGKELFGGRRTLLPTRLVNV